MIRSYKISPYFLLSIVGLLAIAELACGTSVYFTAMMTVVMVSIGLTYNFLGGLSTLSGMAFSVFALRTIVISQFAKVLFLESSEANLESPELTISIYAAFYVSALIGCLILAKARWPLPRPLEPNTLSESRLIYSISFVVGLGSTLVFESFNYGYNTAEEAQYTAARSIALAFSPLLLFALVVAVDLRVRSSDGRDSFGLAAFLPWLAATVIGFIQTTRQGIIQPTIIYVAACYVRGYRFRMKHYIAAALGIPVFVYLIGPVALYNRGLILQKDFAQRAYFTFNTLLAHPDPTEWQTEAEQATEEGGTGREQYYNKPGTYLLSRLSLIRADSNLINACSRGFHYGFEGIEIDLLGAIPTVLYKDKPRYTNDADFIGRISGMSGENAGTAFPALSLISDSYGAFGWTGVILIPLLCFPVILVVYESIFDIRQPWGTVGAGVFLLKFAELNLGGVLPTVFRDTLTLVLLSYLLGGISAMIPMRDNRKAIFAGNLEESRETNRQEAT